MRIFPVIFLALNLLLLSGCSDETTSISSFSNNNVNIRSVNDTLAINISATNHNYDQNIALIFSVDTVNVYMSVSGTGTGSGYFRVLKDTSTVYFKDINTNINLSEKIYTGPPTNAIINLQNYKGNANILLTK
jgi:hypothetical protein